MQILTGLVVAFWLFWPVFSAGATKDYAWEHPGRDPYICTIDFAVEAKPMPKEAKAKLIEMMRKANVSFSRMKQAVEASNLSAEERAEVFGKNAVKSSVVFRPAKGEPQELEGHFFEVDLGGGSKVITFRPLICNNLCFRAVGFSMTKTVELPDSSKREIAKALAAGGPPEASHTFIYNVWSLSRSKPSGRELLEQLISGVQGKQSRDLGGQILAAAASGKVARAEGSEIFKAEFFDLRLDAAKRGRGWVSAADKGHQTMVEVPLDQVVQSVVANGEGRLTFAVKREEKNGTVTYSAPEWATERIAIEVHAPYRGVHYPASGSLKTCGPATAGRCGA